MVIGVPKEIKDNENRVAIVPAGINEFISKGHQVLIETNAGLGSGITNEEYQAAGAEIITSKPELFRRSEMILKVKEPQPCEYELLREGQVLFTFLHLAADLEMTKALLARKIIGIAYETIQLKDGSLPVLAPMSEIAGRMSIQIGAACLQNDHGGQGVLLGGVPGVQRGMVTIIGGGLVGLNAAKMATGLGARVTILDTDLNRLRQLENIFGSRVTTLVSNYQNICQSVISADLIICAVLIPAYRAPKLIDRSMVSQMKKGAVIVDVAIDQGGCTENCKITSHSHPTYVVDGVIHYCVPNIPGIVARTSTFALTNVTLPYTINIAECGGIEKAAQENLALARGINLYRGQVVHEGVAEALALPYHEMEL